MAGTENLLQNSAAFLVNDEQGNSGQGPLPDTSTSQPSASGALEIQPTVPEQQAVSVTPRLDAFPFGILHQSTEVRSATVVGPEADALTGLSQTAVLLAGADNLAGESIFLLGDADGDGDTQLDDSRLILADRGDAATGTDDARDVDQDGRISVFDVRQLALSIRRNRDQVAPEITVLEAEAGERGGGDRPSSPLIEGSVIDDSLITRLRAGVDGAVPENFVDIRGTLREDGSFALTLEQLEQINGGALAAGEHVLHLQAKDRWGNVADEEAISFIVPKLTDPDDIPPVIAAALMEDTGTGNGDGITANPAIAGTVTDVSEIASFRAGLGDKPLADFVDVLGILQLDGRFVLDEATLSSINGDVDLADGSYQLNLIATDVVGNTSEAFTFEFTLDTTAPVASVGTVSEADSTLDIRFDEAVTEDAFLAANYSLVIVDGENAGTSVPITAVSQVSEQVARLTLGTGLAPDENYRLSLGSEIQDLAGNALAAGTNLDVSVEPVPLTVKFFPANGEGSVTLNREAILRFSKPIDPSTVTSESIKFIALGEEVSGRLVVSSTERFVTFFPDEPWNASTEVRIQVDGDQILGRDGIALDADRDGLPGGIATADFRTLSITPIPDTDVFGYVYDAYNRNPDGSNIPLEGVEIRLDALPNVVAVTDENGYFILEDVPAPDFYVYIDGSKVTGLSEGSQYASLGKPFHSVPGQATQLFMDGETFDIYLPLMSDNDVVELSPTEDTAVGFGPDALTFLEDQFPEIDSAVWQRTQVTFGAGSAQDDEGNVATQAMIVPVDPDRLPAPLPPNLNPRLVISIQAGGENGFNREADGGATNFDIPAPIQFPNLEGLAPGEKTSIFSFDHDAGDWINIGSGTVSEDGLVIVSNPDVGILAPGWHTTGSTAAINGSGSGLDNFTGRLQQRNDLINSLLPVLSNTVGKVLNISFSGPPDPITGAQTMADLAENAPTIIDAVEQASQLRNGGSLQEKSFVSNNSPEPIEQLGRQILNALDPLVNELEQLPLGIAENLDNADPLLPNAGLPDADFEELSRALNSFKSILDDLFNNQGFDSLLSEFANELLIWRQDLINSPDFAEVRRPISDIFVQIKTENDLFRFQTNDIGRFRFDGPSNTEFLATLYDPISNRIGYTFGVAGAPGSTTNLGHIPLFPVNGGVDTDNDGIINDAERVIGTSVTNSDTDGDGVNDLAELQQGLDPFGGQAFPTGIIASLPLPGQAKSVALEGSILESEGQTAYVATGTHGLAIVDTSQFDNPILLGQLDLSGDATDIAVDNRLGVAAVATNTGGLQFVDVSDLMLPELRQILNINANQVEIFEGIAYVTTGTSLQAIDLLTGESLQTLNLGSSNLTGLTREGLTLYSMDSEKRLQSIDISNLEMELLDSLVLPDGSGQLFVANGTAYIPAVSNARGGFVTVDVSEPDSIALISGSDVTVPNIAAGQDIVANGSGQGILIGSPGFDASNVLDVIDITDPTDTNPFNTILTRITLPSRPEDVALGSGIAYVANGSSGLQVINYLPFDGFGQAPIITLDSQGRDVDPETPGIQVTEGGLIPLQANVFDDVQVRNVELLVNGEVVSNSVSFPFDLGAIALSNNPNNNTVEVQARAIDTGGNSTLSDPLTFELVPDTFAPVIESITPFENGAVPKNLRRVSVRFNEAIDAADVTTENFRLFNSLGEVVTPENIQLQNRDRTVQLTFDPLAAGDYTLVIDADDVSDRAGNFLGTSDITSAFTLLDGTIFWVGGNGNWNDVNNWVDANNINRLPTAADIVSIDVPGDTTITLNSGSVTIGTLFVEENLAIAGGALTITDAAELNNGLTLTGGNFIANGETTVTGQSLWSGGVLSGELFNKGNLAISGTANKIFSNGTLINEGNITHTQGALFFNNGTLNNNATGIYDLQGGTFTANAGNVRNFNNSGILRKSTNSTVTVGVNVNNNGGTLDIQEGTLRLASSSNIQDGTFTVAENSLLEFASGSHIFNGLITGDSEGVVRLQGGQIVAPDTVTLNFTGGGIDWRSSTLRGGGTFLNQGLLTLSGGTNKVLDSNTTITNEGSITHTAGNLFLNNGTLNNRNGAFYELQSGSITANAGTVRNFNNIGTFRKTTDTTADINVNFNNLNGQVDVNDGILRLTSSNINDGTLTVADGSSIDFASGSHTLNGTITGDGEGVVRLQGGQIVAPDTVTLNLTGGGIDWRSSTLRGGGTFLNQGLLTLSGGTNKVLDSNTTITNEGSITHTAGNLFLNNGIINNSETGLYDLQSGSITANAGTVRNFNNAGTLRKTTDSSTTVNVNVNNNGGTVDVQQGTLRLTQSSNSNGIHRIALNSLLNYASGNHFFLDGYSVTGDGQVLLSSGLLDVSSDGGASFNPIIFEQTGGTFRDA